MSARMCPLAIHNSVAGRINARLHSRCHAVLSSEKAPSPRLHRRLFIVGVASASVLISSLSLSTSPVWAEESSEDKDEGSVVEAVKSLFDPNEKTKSGKVLPKAYLKSAREVVKTLRESLEEDTKDIVKFRRTADAAKQSIREYLNGWRGQQTVVDEESYKLLEKAIRSLASFYSQAGPSAALPEKFKSEILVDLSKAQEFL